MKLDVETTKQYIKENSLVVVVWTEKDCPVCEEFMPQISSAIEEVGGWNLIEINAREHREKHGTYFEPSMFPAIYLFKNGERILERFGFARKEDMLPALTNAKAEGFKTPEQIEQEQLDALE